MHCYKNVEKFFFAAFLDDFLAQFDVSFSFVDAVNEDFFVYFFVDVFGVLDNFGCLNSSTHDCLRKLYRVCYNILNFFTIIISFQFGTSAYQLFATQGYTNR